MAPYFVYDYIRKVHTFCVLCRLQLAYDFVGAYIEEAEEAWWQKQCLHDQDYEDEDALWAKLGSYDDYVDTQKTKAPCPIPSMQICPHPDVEGGFDLPDDIMCRILCRLPLCSLARTRIICQSLRKRVFVDPLLCPVSQSSYLVMSLRLSATCSGIAVHDPCTDGWAQIPIDLSFHKMFRYSDGSGVGGFLCAASGGVFCVIDEWDRNPSNGIVVGNPLSRTWKWLPAFSIMGSYYPSHRFYNSEDSDEISLSRPYTKPYLIALNADPRTGNFEVFLLSFIVADEEVFDDDEPVKTTCIAHVYSSATGTWEQRSPIRTTCAYHHSNSGGVHGKKLCALECNGGISVLVYDLEKHTCQELDFQQNPPELARRVESFVCHLPRLCVWQGRMFCVAVFSGRRLPPDNPIQCLPKRDWGRIPIVQYGPIGIWEFSFDSKETNLLAQVPLHMLEGMIKSALGTDFIVAMHPNGHQILLHLEGSPHVVAYDLPSGLWSMLDWGCPLMGIFDARSRTAFCTPLTWESSF